MTVVNPQTKGVIYRARLIKDGRVYIGQTYHYNKRILAHNKANSYCVYFARAIKKYGPKAFEWSILCELNTQDELDAAEDFFIINYYNSINSRKGFNLKGGGSPHGRMSAISRKKISKALTGIKRSKETREKMSKSKIGVLNGRTLSAEHKQKIGIASSNRVWSEESKRKLREAFVGKPLSEETKEKNANC